MRSSQYLLATLLVAAVSSIWASEILDGAQKLQENGHRLMHTDIAIVGTNQADLKTQSKDGVYVDASNLIDQASALDGKADDIEEDDNDRFITSRTGKVRPMYVDSSDKETDWTNEAPVGNLKGILLRKKRCGGGGGDDDDDDGDANRSRRARRVKRVRRRKVKKNKKKGTVTTVTRKVTQNGQVISHTTETQSQQPATVVAAAQQQVPVVVDASAPVVQHTISTQHTVQVQAQPAVQQVAQPVVQVQAQPEVVQAVAAPAAAAAAAPTVVQQTVPAATVVQSS